MVDIQGCYKPLDELLTDFRAEPDLEFEGLLKRQHTRVKYFQGSLMNAMDLERAKVTERVPRKLDLWRPMSCSKSY